MNTVTERTQAMVSDAALQAYEKLVEILPETLLAIVIVIGGWIVASIIYSFCVKMLGFFAVDKLVAKTPLDKMLKGIGLTKSASEILGLLVFWLAILATLVFAAEMLNLKQVSGALAIVTGYIPHVIAAFLVIVFGMLLARFLQTVVVQSLSKTDLGYGRSIGRAVQFIVLIFVFFAAVEQLGLNLSFLTTNVLLLVATVLLIAGLSVVLGARTVLENVLACQQLKRQVTKDQKILVDDVRGKVKGFTVGGVIIETEGGDSVVPATTFFTKTYTLLK